MNERELSLLESIGEVVKDVLAKQEADLTEKIKRVKAHIDEQILNLKQEIKNKEIVINEKIVEEKIKTLIEEPARQRSELGLLDIEQLINAKIAEVAQSLSAPEIPDIETLLANAIDTLPKPKDGKSVTLDDVKPVIKQGIQEIVDNFPKPKDGKDADPDIVAKKLMALMPKPEDGKRVTLEDIRPLITEEINRLFEQFPKPQNGKDADVKDVVEKLLERMPSPKDGRDGKDALHIELLPAIDESKSYPRGTFATHKGGIWRSFQQTTGMHGWECIVNGHYTESAEFKDARTLSMRSEMSNGSITTSEHTIPTMIYCGVYSAEKEYQTGDVVTWAGSLWHCNEKTKEKPGENASKGWTLIVKRGRDGKDRI